MKNAREVLRLVLEEKNDRRKVARCRRNSGVEVNCDITNTFHIQVDWVFEHESKLLGMTYNTQENRTSTHYYGNEYEWREYSGGKLIHVHDTMTVMMLHATMQKWQDR